MPRPAHTNQANIDAQRKRELGLIHQAKAALHWSDDDYRYHLQQQTGRASAADLDAAGRRKMIEHLASCGWASTTPATRPCWPLSPAPSAWAWPTCAFCRRRRPAPSSRPSSPGSAAPSGRRRFNDE